MTPGNFQHSAAGTLDRPEMPFHLAMLSWQDTRPGQNASQTGAKTKARPLLCFLRCLFGC